MLGSPEFAASVYPMILRGVNLLGVDSVNISQTEKEAVWQGLAADWKLPRLHALATEIGFGQLQQGLDNLLAGKNKGRWVLALRS